MVSMDIATIIGNKDVMATILAKMRQDQMIARLGAGEVFFLTDAGKTKRAFKAPVNLEYPIHFCFPAGADAKPMITAEGFDKLNQYAGVEVFRPKTVVAQDGSEKGNPYFERDPKTGAMLSVFMRGVGVGYAPTGNLTAVDQTVYVSLQTLLVQELQAKIKRYPHLGMMGSPQRPSEITFYKDNGKYGRSKVIDDQPTTIKAVGAWHYVPLTEGLGFWVNISHPEIQAAFEGFTQKQRFLERTTFSILKRLILSSHPAIASKTPHVTELQAGEYNKVISAKAHVIVYGFKADDRSAEEKHQELQAMAMRVADGERMANMEIIQKGATDLASDPEISDASIVADPGEMPPVENEEWQDEPPQVTKPAPVAPPPPPAPVAPPVAKPVAPAAPPAPPAPPAQNLRQRLSAVMRDPANMPAAKAAMGLAGVSTFGALRTADEKILAAFFDAFDAQQGGEA
jgi:hypothetical protein